MCTVKSQDIETVHMIVLTVKFRQIFSPKAPSELFGKVLKYASENCSKLKMKTLGPFIDNCN